MTQQRDEANLILNEARKGGQDIGGGKVTHDLSVHHGMKTRNAILVAAAIGCSVVKCKGHSHYMVGHPSQERRIQVPPTRKDASRAFTAFLKRVINQETGGGAGAIKTDRVTTLIGEPQRSPPKPRHEPRREQRLRHQPAGEPGPGASAMKATQKERNGAAPKTADDPQRSRLGVAGYFELVPYIEQHWDRIVTTKPTKAAFAEEASKALSLTITRSHVDYAMTSVLGPRSSRFSEWPSDERIGSNASVLARAIIHLYREWNLAVPADLAAVAGND